MNQVKPVHSKFYLSLRLAKNSSRDFIETKDKRYKQIRKEAMADARYWRDKMSFNLDLNNKIVNAKCKLIVTHSMRPLQSLELQWSHVAFKYIGSNNPELPAILKSLIETGEARVFEKGKYKGQYLRLSLKRGESILI